MCHHILNFYKSITGGNYMKTLKKLLFYTKHIIWYCSESLFALLLEYKRTKKGDTLFSMEMLPFLAYVSQNGYSDNNVFDTSDQLGDILLTYNCVSIAQLYLLCGDNWYLLAVRHPFCVHIEDFVSATQKCNNIFKVQKYIIDHFSNMKIYARCVEDTSYPLVIKAAQRGIIRILSDEYHIEDNTALHVVTFKTTKKDGRSKTI